MPRETAEKRHIGAESQSREIEREIAALATAQYGVVGKWQLDHLGVGRGAIRRRLERKRLTQLYAGVYAVGHRDLKRESWYMAAVLASGPADLSESLSCAAVRQAGAWAGATLPPPAAVLSHRSAAAHWGIRRPFDGADHVTLPHKSRSTRSVKRHHALLPADEITTHAGIPVTTVPRTLFDLAATSTPEEVEFALREAEYRQLHDPLSLTHLIDRYPGHRGVRNARLALARLSERQTGRPRSPLEEVFVPFLRRHRLPLPELNAWIEAGGRRHQVDCLWRSSRQIVELDGWEGHGTRTAFRDDRARDRRLRVAGYGITRLTWAQLDDEPKAIVADLRHLIGGD